MVTGEVGGERVSDSVAAAQTHSRVQTSNTSGDRFGMMPLNWHRPLPAEKSHQPHHAIHSCGNRGQEQRPGSGLQEGEREAATSSSASQGRSSADLPAHRSSKKMRRCTRGAVNTTRTQKATFDASSAPCQMRGLLHHGLL